MQKKNGLMTDKRIKGYCNDENMIEPFADHQVKEVAGKKVISYGLSSMGYDIRLSDEFKIFTDVNSIIVDPKAFDKKAFVDFNGDICIIPPNSFVLARSLEKINMPNNVTGVVLGKSTYARVGLVTNFTPLEAGWRGYITIEISNTTPLPAKIYAGEGVAQILFFESDEDCEVSYADRGGKYQDQTGITLAKV